MLTQLDLLYQENAEIKNAYIVPYIFITTTSTMYPKYVWVWMLQISEEAFFVLINICVFASVI